MSETQNAPTDDLRQYNDDELLKFIADGKAQLGELKRVQRKARRAQREVQRRERDDLKDIQRWKRAALSALVVDPYQEERNNRSEELLAAARGTSFPPADY